MNASFSIAFDATTMGSSTVVVQQQKRLLDYYIQMLDIITSTQAFKP